MDADDTASSIIKIAAPGKSPMIGDPAPLAMGGFATTLASVSMAMMNFRGVTTQTMFIGNLCFVACIGLVISGQWAMAKGDTFTYTVLTAYGLFYGGYGAMLFPNWNIASSYGTSSEYYNAFGFFLLVWAISNIFFLITSLRLNVIYILIFTCLEFCLTFDAMSHFLKADGYHALFHTLQQVAGAWGFAAAILGHYTAAHYMFGGILDVHLPMWETAAWFDRTFAKNKKRTTSSETKARSSKSSLA